MRSETEKEPTTTTTKTGLVAKPRTQQNIVFNEQEKNGEIFRIFCPVKFSSNLNNLLNFYEIICQKANWTFEWNFCEQFKMLSMFQFLIYWCSFLLFRSVLVMCRVCHALHATIKIWWMWFSFIHIAETIQIFIWHIVRQSQNEPN